MPPSKKYKLGLPRIWSAKKHEIFPLFSGLPHSTPHISGTKRCIDKQQCQCQSTMCPLKLDLLSVTLTQKQLRFVCSLWPTLRRPLRCNHHSCDMSSFHDKAESCERRLPRFTECITAIESWMTANRLKINTENTDFFYLVAKWMDSKH